LGKVEDAFRAAEVSTLTFLSLFSNVGLGLGSKELPEIF
jgi:hypothetical protein